MKAAGIVRYVDDLGRIVIPRDIRHTARIREGDPLEIFILEDGSGIVFKKYNNTVVNDLRSYSDTIRQQLEDHGANSEVRHEAMEHLSVLIKMLEKDYRD